MATRKGKRARRKYGAWAWLKGQFNRRPKPLWMVLLAHVAALGIALVLYALPHHVIPRHEASLGIVSTRGGRPATVTAATAAPEAVPSLEPLPTPASPAEGVPLEEADAVEAADEALDEAAEALAAAPEDTNEPVVAVTQAPMADTDIVGSFRGKFADMFTDGKVERTSSTYRSANLNISIHDEYVSTVRARVYIADIYIADISCLMTVFGKDTYGRGYTEWITDVAKRMESIVTLNGDYYGTRDTGVVIRNGTLYRDNKTTNDIAILYWDGRFEIFKGGKIDAKAEMANGAYQSWCFGPALMDGNGKPLEKFNCNDNLTKKNPRSAIGYYEPGHYCFLVVDGRNKESRGASMEQLAGLMEYFGCKQGYNLDGGQTSLLAAGPDLINRPSDGGRNSSDYILIVDRVTQ